MPISLLRNSVIPTFLSKARSGVEELQEQFRGGTGVQQAINRFKTGFNQPQDPVSSLVRKHTQRIQQSFQPQLQTPNISREEAASRFGQRVIDFTPVGATTRLSSAARKVPQSFIKKFGRTIGNEAQKFLDETTQFPRQGVRFRFGSRKIREIIDKADDIVDERQVQRAMRDINAGKFRPLVVNAKNELLDGSHRLQAAKRLKINEVPIVRESRVKTLRLDGKFAGSRSLASSQAGFINIDEIAQGIGRLTRGLTGRGRQVGQGVSSTQSNKTVGKVIDALKQAKPLRGAQERLATAERKRRVARVAAIGEQVGGEQGFRTQLGALKGELPKMEFESVRKLFKQPEVDEMFDMVERSETLLPLEKVTAKTGLAKMFGAAGGAVPTRNEIALMKEVFGEELATQLLKKRPFGEKLFHTVQEVLNVPRAVMTSFDLSAPFRQGVFLIGRPKQFIPAFSDMFRYAFNEKSYEGLQAALRKRPTFKLMKQSGLAITDLDGPLTAREEAFISQLPEKIPVFGRAIRASNRAYTGFLNKLRADTFDDLIRKSDALGIEKTDRLLSDMSKFINSATGRGSLGELNKAVPALNAIFFSPRLIASRLNMLNPLFYVSLSPSVRKEALKSLLTFGAASGTVLGLADMSPGVEVGKDPRSADFGKIKVGNTRYDILGGFQQYIRLASQLISGTIVSSTTGREITLGEGYKPLTRKDITYRFFENKTSPVASFILGLSQGQTPIGEEFAIPEQALQRFIPMASEDLYDLWQEDGLVGVVEWLPALFGTGAQTYGEQELVFGQDRFGQESAEIRPVRGLGERISEEVFGPRPIQGSKNFNVEVFYDQMSELPRDEAAEIFDKINESNPDLADKIRRVVKDREKGLTVKDKTLKSKGVANGDRAFAIKRELDKAKTQEDKAQLWEDMTQKGIISDTVAQQVYILLQENQ